MKAPSVEITTAVPCLNACDYCALAALSKSYARRGPQFLSLETFETILRKLPADLEVHFSGCCEPCRNPDCIGLVAASARAGFSTHIFTTGVCMLPGDRDRISAMNRASVVVRVPGEHDRWPGTVPGFPDAFERLLRTTVPF